MVLKLLVLELIILYDISCHIHCMCYNSLYKVTVTQTTNKLLYCVSVTRIQNLTFLGAAWVETNSVKICQYCNICVSLHQKQIEENFYLRHEQVQYVCVSKLISNNTALGLPMKGTMFF